MFRNGRAASPKILRNLADGGGADAQQSENFPSSRIGNRLENQFTLFALYRNHMVTSSVTEWLPSVKCLAIGKLSFAKMSSDSKMPRLVLMYPSSKTLHPIFQVVETKGERVLAKDTIGVTLHSVSVLLVELATLKNNRDPRKVSLHIWLLLHEKR